ncbi:MAG TPA: GAF domain-containing protein [Polyangium sp.]|jgi:GAF domain-containing protein|nr:GAF domain-containing protein [Polyangium sp.]
MTRQFISFRQLQGLVIRERPLHIQYGIAIILFSAALVVTLLLRPWIVPSPFPFFFFATMLAGCLGGLGPGMLATALGSWAVLQFFLPSFWAESGGINISTIIRFGAFFVVSVLLGGLAAALRTALRTADVTLEALKQAEIDRAGLFAREQAARTEAEAAKARFAFLAEASELLDASLDYTTTLASVAVLAVPHLGDWCIIDTAETDEEVDSQAKPFFSRLTVAHADPARRAVAHQLKLGHPPHADDAHGAPQVARTGASEFVADVSEAWIREFARNEAHLRLLEELGLSSYLCVPMAARGRILGAITLVRGKTQPRYDTSDLALAEDLAHRAALAIDTARLYHRARGAEATE